MDVAEFGVRQAIWLSVTIHAKLMPHATTVPPYVALIAIISVSSLLESLSRSCGSYRHVSELPRIDHALLAPANDLRTCYFDVILGPTYTYVRVVDSVPFLRDDIQMPCFADLRRAWPNDAAADSMRWVGVRAAIRGTDHGYGSSYRSIKPAEECRFCRRENMH